MPRSDSSFPEPTQWNGGPDDDPWNPVHHRHRNEPGRGHRKPTPCDWSGCQNLAGLGAVSHQTYGRFCSRVCLELAEQSFLDRMSQALRQRLAKASGE